MTNVDTEVLKILTNAQKKVRQGWLVGAPAQTEDGKYVRPTSAQACKWDLAGAVKAVSGSAAAKKRAMRRLRAAVKTVKVRDSLGQYVHWFDYRDKNALVGSLNSWNDSMGTKKRVLKVFDKALELV